MVISMDNVIQIIVHAPVEELSPHIKVLNGNGKSCATIFADQIMNFHDTKGSTPDTSGVAQKSQTTGLSTEELLELPKLSLFNIRLLNLLLEVIVLDTWNFDNKKDSLDRLDYPTALKIDSYVRYLTLKRTLRSKDDMNRFSPMELLERDAKYQTIENNVVVAAPFFTLYLEVTTKILHI